MGACPPRRRDRSFAMLLLTLAACGGAPAVDAGGASDAGGEAVAPDAPSSDVPTEPPLEAVALADPFIGSGGLWFHAGSINPAASVPLGFVKLGPDTTQSGGAAGANHCSGYHADDPLVLGFSHVRLQGTGIPDAGHVRFVPARGPMSRDRTHPLGYRATLDRATEVAGPGHYRVRLVEPDVAIELSATARTGAHRYTWGPGAAGEPLLLLDLGRGLAGAVASEAHVRVDPGSREVHGHTRITGQFSGGVTVWFSASFDAAWEAAGTWQDGQPTEAPEAEGASIGAWLRFPAGSGPVQARVGLSFVDAAGALANLHGELPGADLDAVREAARQAWASKLGALRAWGGDPTRQVLLASALYRVLLMPDVFTDLDGRYRGLDGAVHVAEGFTYHTNFSLWDTWRTVHPLYVLLWPEHQRDFVRSLLAMAEQAGALPRWPLWTRETNCMIGSHADVVIADSYVKGLGGFDAEEAWAAVLAIADHPPPAGSQVEGRGTGVEDYKRLGYVAADRDAAAASRTLEYAAEDAGVAAFAAALGRSADAARFAARAESYRNLFDPVTRFFRGRNADGSWAEPFDEADWHPWYTEGNARQYRWLVPHDPEGLADLLGGKAAAAELLEAFLQGGLDGWEAYHRAGLPAPTWYWHGNEPDIHAACLFHDFGHPDRANRWVRTIADTMYGPGRDGLAGNDDAGTLSAWYVFAALGLYPVAGTDRYWLGSPMFPRLELDLEGGPLVIEAPHAAAGHVDVTSITLDGRPLPGPYVTHGELLGGRTLRFEQAPSTDLPRPAASPSPSPPR